MAESMVYRRLRAPSADGGVLLDPPAAEIPALVAANLSRLHDTAGELRELLRDARRILVDEAIRHTGRYSDVDWVQGLREGNRIYMVGHQPELFHPGVWLKNFVLDSLAKRDGALAVHVLIDNDEASTPAIRVPTGSLAEPQIASVAFDERAAPCAWEERWIQDRTTFLSFGQRVRSTVSPIVSEPLVAAMWENAGTALETGSTLGQAIAQLRHRQEIAWGVRTVEVPLSRLVSSPAFQALEARILTDLPRFHAVHNAALAEYRAVHKLRSPSQPLPDLASNGGALEAPFWVWKLDDATRRKLFVSRSKDTDADNAGWQFRSGADGSSVCFATDRGPGMLASTLPSLEKLGVKIRPRALVTTIMLRLLASDLFIHGIGGAKYDQVTDRIIENFFGVDPPGFLTATGTRLLPLPHGGVSSEDVRAIDRRLRELRFKPEEHLDVGTHPPEERERIARLITEKRNWLSAEVSPDQLAERHQRLAMINAELENYVSSRRDELTADRLRIEAEMRRHAILGSREFAFCLYPETTLRPWLLDAATQAL